MLLTWNLHFSGMWQAKLHIFQLVVSALRKMKWSAMMDSDWDNGVEGGVESSLRH